MRRQARRISHSSDSPCHTESQMLMQALTGLSCPSQAQHAGRDIQL